MPIIESFQIAAPSEILVNKNTLPVEGISSAICFHDMIFPVANAVTALASDVTALRRMNELVYVDLTLHGNSRTALGLILAAAELINVKTFDCNLLWVHVSNEAYARRCNLHQRSVHCYRRGQRDAQM